MSTLQTFRRHRKPLGGALAALMAFWQIGQPLQAVDFTWDPNANGSAGSGTWNQLNTLWNGPASWVNGGGNNAIFGGASGVAGTITLGEAINAGSLIFNTGGFTGNYVIDTSTLGLTLNTGITANESATIQSGVGGSVVLGANNIWSVANTKTLTVSSGISGSGFGITKSGLGTLTLAGDNTFDGATTVSRGTLLLDYTSNTSKLSDTAALNLNGGTVSLTGGSHTEVVQSVALGAGASAVTQVTPASTLQMNTITRALGGTLNLGAASIASTDNTNDVGGILGGWATVGGTDWAINSTNAADGAITALASYTNDTWAAGSNITVTGSSAQAANATAHSLRFNAATPSTVTLTGTTNTITTGGILVTSTVGANAQIITGGTLRGSSGGDLSVFQNNTAGTLRIESILADNTSATGLTKSGAGTLELAGINTFTGQVTVNAGTLSAITSTQALGTGAATVVLNGGTLRLASDTGTTFGRNTTVAGNSTIVVDKIGVTASASTTHVMGTLSLGDVILTINRGSFITGNNNAQVNFGATTLTGSPTISQNVRGNIQFAAITESGGPQSLTVGVPGIANGGNSVVILNGAGSWTGGTVVNSGSLRANVANSLGASVGLTTVNGGTLDLRVADSALNRNITFAGTGTLALTNSTSGTTFNIGTLAQTAGTLTITTQRASGDGTITQILNEAITLNGNLVLNTVNSANTTTLRFQGAISDGAGTNNVSKTGAGVVILEAASAHDGLTTITAGTLQIGVANALPSGAGKGNLTMNPAVSTTATLNLNGRDQTLNGLSSSGLGSSVIDNTSASITPVTLTIGDNNGTGTFAGTIQDTGAGDLSLVKTGAGTITLSGTGTYAGSTSVNGGILLVQPSVLTNTGTVNVGTSANGTLGFVPDGTGSLMTLANNTPLNLGSASTSGGLFFQLGADTASSDRIALGGTGALTVAAGGGLINGLNLGTFTAGTYDLITGSVGITGLANVLPGSLPGGFTYSFTEPATGTLRMTSTAVGAGNLFWIGDVNSSWSTPLANTNWSTTSGSNTEAGYTPGASTTVNFSAAGAANFSTTLDQNYSVAGINILTGGSAVSISPGLIGTLTIGTGGIDVQTGAPASTIISAPVTATGNQAWTVTDSGSVLTVNAGVAASGNLTKAGAGTLTLGPVASSVTGLLNVSAGTLQMAGGNLSAGSLSGAGTVENSSGSNVTLTITGSANSSFSGSLQNGGVGTLSVQKGGSGLLTLSGTNTFTGTLNITADSGAAGRVAITGSTTGASNFNVGALANGRGILTIGTGATVSVVDVDMGTNAAISAGGTYLTDGSLTITGADATDRFALGSTINSYGYFQQSGGTLNTARITVGGNAGTNTGVYSMTGGTATVPTWVVVANGGSSNGLLDISGGTLNAGTNFATGFASAAGAYGVINVRGSGTINHTGSTAMLIFRGNSNTQDNSTNILNLLTGGTIRTNSGGITNGTTSGAINNLMLVNLNGGTIITNAATTNLININNTNSVLTSTSGAYLYSGGLTVDTNSFNSTLPASLLAPTGEGVSTIPVSTQGSGYVGAPMIKISGGTGVGATAVANMEDDGSGNGTYRIASITVTNPGSGYVNSDVLTVSFADNTNTYTTQATLGAVVFNGGNTSGGLTKIGNGTLTLTGTNTFSGATIVNGGTLSIRPTALPNTSSLQVGVTGNGAFDLFQDGVGAAWAPAANTSITLGSASFSGALGFQLATPGTSDTITLSGTGALTVNAGGGIINANAITGFAAGTYSLVTGPNNIVGGANLSLGILPVGFGYTLDYATDPTILALIVSAAAAGDVYYTGDVNGSWAQAGNTNWSTTSNGLTEAGFTPGTTSTVNFSATNAGVGAIVTTLDAAFSIQGLNVLNSSTGAVTINPGTGGSLTIGTGGIDVQTGAPALTAITAPVAIGASQSWNVTSSGQTLSVTGVLSGANTLTKTGAGTVVLNANNTFTGTLQLDAGTLRNEFAGTTGLGTGAATLALNGGRLELANDTARNSARNTTVTANSTISTERLTAGTGVTHTLGTLSIGANTLNVTSAVADLGTQGLTFGATTLSGNAQFNVTNGATTTLLTLGAVSGTGFGTTITGNGDFTFGGINSTGVGGFVTFDENFTGTGRMGNLAHTFQGALTVRSGTVIGTTNAATFGRSNAADSIVLGSTGSVNAVILSLAGSGFTTARRLTLIDDATNTSITVGSTTPNSYLITGLVTLGASTTLRVDNTGAGAITLGSVGGITGTGALTNVSSGSGNVTIGGTIGVGTIGLITQNSTTSSLIFGGTTANTFNNGLTIQAGTVIGGNNANTFGANTNVITLGHTSGSADTQLRPVNNFTYLQPITVQGGNTGVATLMLGNTTGNVIWGGPITLDTHDLTIAKTGTTGTTQVIGGITGTGNLTIDNDATDTGTITLATTAINHTGSITNLGSAAGTTTISANIGSNVTSVTQNSATSQLTLSGNNSFNGGIVIDAGILRGVGQTPTGPFPASPTVDPFGNNTITLNGGTLQVRDNADGGTTARSLTYNNPIVVTANASINADRINGTGTSHIVRFGRLTIDNGATLAMSNANGYDLQFNGGTSAATYNTLLSNAVFNVATGLEVTFLSNESSTATTADNHALADGAGSFGFTKTGAGTLLLGRTVIDGTIQVDAGILSLNNGNNAITAPIVVNAGTLQLRAANAGLTANFDYLGNATLGLLTNTTGVNTFQVASLDIAGDATNFTLNVNRISGSSASGTNALRGPVTTNGALQFDVTGGAGRVAEIDNNVVSSVTLGGDITFNPTTANLSIAAVITDAAGSYSLTKIGAGTLTLGGTNTYDGATNINEGTLIINGDNSGSLGAVNVALGATLGGTGTIGGDTTISGIHNPGNSPGLQTFAGDLSYTGATINWELYGNTDTITDRGTALGWDGINVGGVLSFSSTTFNLNFGTTALGSLHNWGDALFWGSDREWLVYSGASSLTGMPSLNLIDWPDAQGDLFSTIVGSFSLTNKGGNNVYLNFTAIPEPSRAMLLLLGLLGLGLRRRREGV